MLVWLAFAILTGLAVGCAILPLAKARRAPPERAAYDRAVYRDQLAEIERDRARGLLSAAEVESARIEVERRLLGTAALGEAGPRAARGAAVPAALVIALALAVPAGAVAVYVLQGSPRLPDLPYASRASERAVAEAGGNRALERTAKALEAKLAQAPEDAESWLLLARTRQALGHWKESGEAYRRALALTQQRPDVAAAYGEMLVMEADGIVTAPAREALSAALARDARNAAARYYLALAEAQAGNAASAIEAWQKLLADSPADAPWIPTVRRSIAETAKAAGLPVPPPPAAAAPGPGADDLAAASQMSPEERTQMVRGMVERLAARLEQQPDDLEGWLRLARAYDVLQDRAKAAAAYDRAAALKPGDASILAHEIDALMAGYKPADPIPESTLAVLRRLEAIDADEPRVLWYLGLAAAQAHRLEEAKTRWRKLLALLPPESPEHKLVATALSGLPADN